MAQSKGTDTSCLGHRGLENPDSTCYLNAVLQTLFMTKEFREHVKSDSSADNFIKELKKLFIELEKQQKTAVSAAEVTKSLGIEVHKQADAAEHLHLIIKTLTLIKKTPEYSEFFKVTLKTTRTCRSCSEKQEALEEFLSLPVSFKDSQDVEDAVNAYVDRVRGEYTPTCSCSKATTDWERQTFPKILIIQLERFEMGTSGFKKRVQIRPHIEVSSIEYDLYAIIYHTDKNQSPHYYVDIECGQICCRFDDESVSESPINVLFRNKSSTFRSSKAYLLVYRRKE